MVRNIAVRGKKEIVALFNKYAQISGKQDTGRPQAAKEFIEYVAGLPMNDETAVELKLSSKQRIDVSGIDEKSVPASIKIPVEVDEKMWDKAMEIFKYVFDLQSNPQMPYFLRVAGMACIKNLEVQNAKLGIVEVTLIEDENKGIMNIDAFKKLSTDDKLITIYKLLVERGV